MKNSYNYTILRHNCPELARESTLLENNYKKTKYALINKMVHKDGSESISTIVYSNDLETLTRRSMSFISWYNYVIGLKQDIQGNISLTVINT